MTTQLPGLDSAYIHSDDEILSRDESTSLDDSESYDGIHDKEAIDTTLFDAEDFIFEQNKGALKVSLYGPSTTTTKVYAILTSAGKMVRIEEEGAGYLHPSFESYHKTKKFIKKSNDASGSYVDYEDALYFDREADPSYQHSHPGTLTIHGYGLDCWDYVEEKQYGFMFLRRGNANCTPTPLPSASVKQLLRRVNDLKERRTDKFGLYGESQDYFAEEDTDLRQLIGTEAMSGVSSTMDIYGSTVALLNVLNRSDLFADMTKAPCIAQEWNTESPDDALGMWAFIYQMIITTELVRRLATGEARGGSSNFSRQVLASLIIADKWMSNVEPRMSEGLPLPEARDISAEAKAQIEQMLALSEEAMEDEESEIAAHFLAIAMALDPTNIRYRQARCRALIMAGEGSAEVGNKEAITRLYAEGVVDARRLTQYTPNDWTAWGFLAKAQFGRGAIKKCLQAWEQALAAAEAAGKGDDSKKIIRENIGAARMGLVDEFLEAAGISDPAERHRGMNQIKEWDFDILGNVIKWWSNVHGQQEEGLVKFAESLQWPYLDEVRGHITRLFDRLFTLQEKDVYRSLHDWLFGLLLPGNWFAESIMTSLVGCTASLSKIGFSSSGWPGLVLPRVTYWRTSTVLGRVLGALPGVKSVNGWVGPCPPVEIDLDFEGQQQMLWVDLGTTPRVSPNLQRVPFHDPVTYNEDGNEDVATYAAEVTDTAKWTIPKAPARDDRQYTLKSILLKHTKEHGATFESADLICDAHLEFVVTRPAHKGTSKRKFLAQKLFSHGSSSKIEHTVSLRTSPVFVVPPKCVPSDAAGHTIHVRRAGEYAMQTWSPDELVDDDTFAKAERDGIIIVNATGNGAETMARAVCALRGLNAVIRISQGPCYKCAIEAARGLKMSILVWCD